MKRINLGLLKAHRVFLSPHEAIAIVHQVCELMKHVDERGHSIAPPLLSDLFVTEAGTIAIEHDSRDARAGGSLKDLLDELMPFDRSEGEILSTGDARAYGRNMLDRKPRHVEGASDQLVLQELFQRLEETQELEASPPEPRTDATAPQGAWSPTIPVVFAERADVAFADEVESYEASQHDNQPHDDAAPQTQAHEAELGVDRVNETFDDSRFTADDLTERLIDRGDAHATERIADPIEDPLPDAFTEPIQTLFTGPVADPAAARVAHRMAARQDEGGVEAFELAFDDDPTTPALGERPLHSSRARADRLGVPRFALPAARRDSGRTQLAVAALIVLGLGASTMVLTRGLGVSVSAAVPDEVEALVGKVSGSVRRAFDRSGPVDTAAQGRPEPARTGTTPPPPEFNRTAPAAAKPGGNLLQVSSRTSSPATPAEIEAITHRTFYSTGAAGRAILSPDGGLIAYADDGIDEPRGIYVARADGSGAERVSGPGRAAAPSWSPDKTWLAFVRTEADRPNVWNLWVYRVESRELRRLSSHTADVVRGATWFPDGRRLCYGSGGALILVDVASGSARRFPSPLPGRTIGRSSVSPDGRQVAFALERDGIWLLDVTSGRMRRVIEDADATDDVSWSGRGGRVLYYSLNASGQGAWLGAPTGGGATALR